MVSQFTKLGVRVENDEEIERCKEEGRDDGLPVASEGIIVDLLAHGAGEIDPLLGVEILPQATVAREAVPLLAHARDAPAQIAHREVAEDGDDQLIGQDVEEREVAEFEIVLSVSSLHSFLSTKRCDDAFGPRPVDTRLRDGGGEIEEMEEGKEEMGWMESLYRGVRKRERETRETRRFRSLNPTNPQPKPANQQFVALMYKIEPNAFDRLCPAFPAVSPFALPLNPHHKENSNYLPSFAYYIRRIIHSYIR